MLADEDPAGHTRSVPAGGPVLLFGGPYSNLEATAAVLAEAGRRGIPPARIICTGDVVAYGADPAATVDLVRRSGVHVVMGNCEEQLAEDRTDCGCGYAPGSSCDVLSAAWYRFAQRSLREDQRRWMGSLPRRLRLDVGGRALAVIHGEFARRQSWAGRPVNWHMARGLLIAALSVLAVHYGYLRG